MRTRLLSIAAAQVGWLTVVLAAARQREWLAVACGLTTVLLLALLAPNRRQVARFAIIGAVLGPTLDWCLVRGGLLTLGTPLLAGVWMPIWWWALWGMFCASVPHGYQFLFDRLPIAAVLGATFGPASYLAGERLGAITVPEPTRRLSLLAIACLWGLAFPALVAWARPTGHGVVGSRQ